MDIGVDALVQLGAAGAITLVVLSYLKRNLDGVSRMPEMLLDYMRQDGREMVEALKDTANALREAIVSQQNHHAQLVDHTTRQTDAIDKLTSIVYTMDARLQNVEALASAFVKRPLFNTQPEGSHEQSSQGT